MGDRTTKPGNQIDLDLGRVRENLAGNQIDFNFETLNCSGRWVYQDSLDIPLVFSTDWADHAPLDIPLVFTCEGGGGPGPTFFSGFFSATSGAAVSVDVGYTESLYPAAWTGEGASAQLGFTFKFVAYSGEEIGGTWNCSDANSRNLQVFESVGHTNIVQNTYPQYFSSTSGSPGATSGANCSTTTAVPAGGGISVSFKVTRTGSVYDNDLTDALFEFGLFATDDPSNIVRPTYDWSYSDVFYVNPSITKVFARFRWGTSGGTLVVGGTTTSWTSGGKTIDDGSTLITFKTKPSGANTVVELYLDDALVATNTLAGQLFTSAVPVWHYHNYTSGTEFKVTDISFSDCYYSPIAFYPGDGFGDITFESGESGLVNLAPTYALYPSASTGERGEAALAPTVSLSAAALTGEYATETLTTYPAWTPSFAAISGESASVVINTTGAFSTLDAYSGESSTLVLAARPAALFDLPFYSGESFGWNLATKPTFTFRSYTGETTTLVLKDYPAPGIAVDGHTGERLDIALQIGKQLGVISSYSGERVIVDVSNLDNYVVQVGESAAAALATEIVLVANSRGGESASLVIKNAPSESIGTFRAYTGAYGVVNLKTMPSAILALNPIHQWHDAVVGFDTATSFDLLNTSCCPKIGSYELIELNEMEPPDIQYSGNKVIFQADLSTRPRLSAFAFTGETFRLDDPNWLLDINGSSGQVASVTSLVFEEHNFNLCYGNLIPDSQFADVELISLDNWSCDAHMACAGEAMDLVNLEVSPNFSPEGPGGQRADVELIVDPALKLQCWTGETAYDPTYYIRPLIGSGETTQFTFAGETYSGGAGQSAVLTTLATGYEVEFMELGCLDNEYVPADEDGDPDPTKANPVPVELDFFVHSIKARCF